MEKTFTAFALIAFLCGCVSQPVNQSDAQKAEDACIAACKTALEGSQDLNSGPCLSEQITNDWVCDVAHSPRMPVDNQPENQCQAFRNGEAHHFVEVDLQCNVLKVY